MSVEKRSTGYTVRWRDSAGKQRSRQVQLWRDAVALDGEMKRKRAMGELIAHEKGTIRLCDFWELWWQRYALVALTPRTQETYRALFVKHVLPSLGMSPLRRMTREDVSTLAGRLGNKVAPSTLRKILAILQCVLQRAVEWGYIGTNPASGVKRPALVQRRGRALTPEQVNALVSELPGEPSRAFVMMLAWTGLRPGELRALRWDDLGPDLIRVERAMSKNVIGPTKTRSSRSVDFRNEPRKHLLEWYMMCGKPAGDELIFSWSDRSYGHWQSVTFKRAAERAGLRGVVAYDLRHTFASRLIRDGRDPIEVARQLGHSPVLTLETYAHEFEQRRQSVYSECAEELGIAGILSARRDI